jgi:hypothetical protein
VLSLVVFITLVCQTTLIEGQALSPYVRGALKRLLVTLVSILILEVLRVSAIDFILINQLNVHPLHATGAYVFFPCLWWVLYLRVFEYLTKRANRASTAVFVNLADLKTEGDFRRNTALLRLFIDRTPIAVAFAVFCFLYLAAKTLILGLS